MLCSPCTSPRKTFWFTRDFSLQRLGWHLIQKIRPWVGTAPLTCLFDSIGKILPSACSCAAWMCLLHVLCSVDMSTSCPVQCGHACSMFYEAWMCLLHVLCNMDACICSMPCAAWRRMPSGWVPHKPRKPRGSQEVSCPTNTFHNEHGPALCLCWECGWGSGLIICIIFQPCVPLLSGRLWASVDIKPKWKSECLIWWWQFHSWKLC